MNTGAARVVCSLNQGKKCFKRAKLPSQSKPSPSCYFFEYYVYNGKAVITIRISTTSNVFVEFKADTVAANIQLLLDLKDLKENLILVNYPEDRVEHKSTKSYYPIPYKHGHFLWD